MDGNNHCCPIITLLIEIKTLPTEYIAMFAVNILMRIDISYTVIKICSQNISIRFPSDIFTRGVGNKLMILLNIPLMQRYI